ncbi:MAG: alpha/beta fold hydrolase [Cyclobacteriaceae bacterium]|nr:alpha/beta fold hydrolase [Cyclobacteriaceae bacterium]
MHLRINEYLMNITAKTISFLFSVCWAILATAQPGVKIADIGAFETTGGDVIPSCQIGYRTVGQLNSEKSNAILWPTWFTGTSDDLFTSPAMGDLLDTAGLYIIFVDALADGISSSPSNTVDFPDVTIRDMVNSQYILVTRHLGLSHLAAVVGISMGGMQAFEWAVAYPSFMDKVISIVGTPRQSFYDLLVWQAQIALIEGAGDNQAKQEEAMKRVVDISVMNLQTPALLARTLSPDSLDIYMSRQYVQAMAPADRLAQLKAMKNHDIYKSANTDPATIKTIITAQMLLVVSVQDHVVNPFHSVAFSKSFGCKLVELTGDCGHLAPWCEAGKVKKAITAFLK